MEHRPVMPPCPPLPGTVGARRPATSAHACLRRDHAVLAKSLYAGGPPGTAIAAADLHTGAQVMYHGGDLAEAAFAAVPAASWYRTTGRAWRPSVVGVPTGR